MYALDTLDFRILPMASKRSAVRSHLKGSSSHSAFALQELPLLASIYMLIFAIITELFSSRRWLLLAP